MPKRSAKHKNMNMADNWSVGKERMRGMLGLDKAGILSMIIIQVRSALGSSVKNETQS